MYELKPAGRKGWVTVTFSLKTAEGHTVSVAGSFNDWDPAATPMKYDPKECVYRSSVTLQLAPGEHEYKFVIDDKWEEDESNPHFCPNDFGGLNSVLQVPSDDLPGSSAPAEKPFPGNAPEATTDGR